MKNKTIIEKGEHIKGTYLKYDWLIMRQDMGHLCGYVRLWKDHPLEAVFLHSEDIAYDEIDIDCHGDLTFSEEVTKKDKDMIKKGFSPGYWIGWDYAHAGDYTELSPFLGDKKWSVDEVIKECYDVIEQLTKKYL